MAGGGLASGRCLAARSCDSVSPGRYVKGAGSSGFAFDRRPRIALVYAVGEIVGGESQGGAFDFLNAPEEDRYTLRDGRPFDDSR